MGEFVLNAYNVTVDGYGQATYHSRSRGMALGDAWRSEAFHSMKFKDFLKLARCQRIPHAWASANLGAPITVNGRSAFFVESNRQYVRFTYPDSHVIHNAHPLQVKPIEYRPETYRSEKFDAQ